MHRCVTEMLLSLQADDHEYFFLTNKKVDDKNKRLLTVGTTFTRHPTTTVV